MLRPGDEVGVWVIERPLGQGRPRVFRAFNREDPTLLAAIKPLDDTLPGWDLVRQRLLRDARPLLDLQHSNLAKVRGFRLVSPYPCIEMAWVEGEPLSTRLPGPPGDPREVVRWLGDLAGALTALHRVGLRHRDVKPENLLRTERGAVVLVDLGLPLGVPSPDPEDWPWVPPEWLPGGDGGNAALWDLYGAGAVACALLTGRPPPDLAGLSASELRRARLQAGPLDPGPGVPRALRALVGELTAPNPEQRLGSAAELLERLGELETRETLPVRVERVSALRGGAELVEVVAPAQRRELRRMAHAPLEPAAPPAPPPEPEGAPLWPAVIVLAVLLALVIYAL